MILHYLKKKDNQDTKLYKNLYIDIIDSTKFIAKNKLKIINIDFNITFEIVTILLFCIFFGQKYKKNIDLKNKNQILMNIFTEDIDHSLRLSGLDMTLGKYVKSYLKKFYFRISELDAIFNSKKYGVTLPDIPAESVVKKGLPVPAAKITIRPFSKCLTALLLI